MKGLDEMIKELCPDGVEFVKLGECCNFVNGFAFKSSKFKEKGDTIIRITNINGTGVDVNDVKYFNKSDYKANWQTFEIHKGDILIAMSGATTGKVGIYNNKTIAYLNQRVGKIVPDKSKLVNRFLYHILLSKNQFLYMLAGGGAQPNLSSTKLMNVFEIPLPPIEVQTEIVRILDKFTSLEAELEAELKAELDCRKRQYEYYRDKLLSFENVEGQEVEWKKIGEICDTLSGFPFDSSKFQTSGIKLMRGKNVKRGYFDFNEDDDRYWESPDGLEKYLLQDKDIIISMDGSLVGKSFAMLSKKHLPLLLVQRVARVRAKRVNPNFLFHNIAHRFSGYVDKKKTGGAIPHVSMKDIQNFSIPVPSLQEQERITTILDRFESLTTSLQSGLPAEISARRQQYEYYRDKLLTFKRKGAV